MKALIVLAFLVVMHAVAAAQPVAVDYVRFDLPDGWVRQEETRYAAFAAPDGQATIAILTRLGDEDADDLLEAFIAQTETGETSIERGKREELPNASFAAYRQATTSRTAEGRTIHRIYTAATLDDAGTVMVAEAEASVFPTVEPLLRAALRSISLVAPDSPTAEKSPPEARPGEGGLDGLYVGARERPFLDFSEGGKWGSAERLDIYAFDPLGQVFRGPPTRLDVGIYDQCGVGDAWRCGRYRIEGDTIALRWSDGTTERRTFAKDADRLVIAGEYYSAAGAPVTPSGTYAYQDGFNTGFWQIAGGQPPTIVFSDDGRFQLRGVSGFGSAKVGEGVSASGRFKIDGRTMTLVYATGATEVVGIAPFSASQHEMVLIGGRVFMKGSNAGNGQR